MEAAWQEPRPPRMTPFFRFRPLGGGAPAVPLDIHSGGNNAQHTDLRDQETLVAVLGLSRQFSLEDISMHWLSPRTVEVDCLDSNPSSVTF